MQHLSAEHNTESVLVMTRYLRIAFTMMNLAYIYIYTQSEHDSPSSLLAWNRFQKITLITKNASTVVGVVHKKKFTLYTAYILKCEF